MKNSKITWVLFLIAFMTINLTGSSKVMAQPGVNISFQTFHDELQPYGRWVYDSEDGDIWIPDVDRDFRPYATRGHWIVTDYGNTWVSDYQWGWAPFHYGRWRNDNRYGWVWVPGSEWGPAWVSWRSGGGYYGWAPLGPRINISIGINLPLDLWVFVPQRYISSPMIYSYYEPRMRYGNIYHNTTIINNFYTNNNRNYVYGPRPNEIERATHSRVQVYRVTDAGRPGNMVAHNGTVNIYRPQVTGRPDFHNNGPDRNADNRNNGSRDQDNRSRPDYSNSGNRAADTHRDAPAATPSQGQNPDRNSGNSGRNTPNSDRGNNGTADRNNNNVPDRAQRAQQPDRTPAAEQNSPYRRESVYAEKTEAQQRANREQSARQNPNAGRREEPVRREAPQPQAQSRSNERTQSRSQEPQKQKDDSRSSSSRERPGRAQ